MSSFRQQKLVSSADFAKILIRICSLAQYPFVLYIDSSAVILQVD